MLTSQVLSLVQGQMNVFFAGLDSFKLESSDIARALEVFWRCNKQISFKYYETQLSIEDFYHSDKYAVFLYFLSHTLYKANRPKLATKAYYLNKILHGVDLFYEICLPEAFYLTHPVGSVFGRAEYGNLCGHLPLTHRPTLLDKPICKCRFAVINMSDDRKITNILLFESILCVHSYVPIMQNLRRDCDTP